MTAQVLGEFDRAGVPSILLKGPSTARWLYRDEPRMYEDCDLLVPPDATGVAERALRQLGFVPGLEERRMPAWWREHAVGWVDPQRAAAIDLHRTLTGVGVEDARLFEVLSADTETMIVGGFPAPVLSLPGRALHLALHAAQHGGDRGELRRALVQAEEETWRDAARLSYELEATPAFAAGLRLVEQGEALADRIGLDFASPLDVSLRASGALAQALTIDRFAGASGTRQRIAIVRHKLFPPATFMRHWSPLARRGRAGLLFAYGSRLLWVVRVAPAAIRVWLRARREARGRPAHE
jgi:Uncharacterised nucleotidyltransferase